MKKLGLLLLCPVLAFAQDHGHSHGSAGEAEHSFPTLLVLLGLAVVGGVVFFMKKKK